MWGVSFKTERDPPMLIGTSWDNERTRIAPPTEPTRPLLFRTHKMAADWCRERNTYWHSTDYGKKWRAQPRRVHEIVSVIR